MSTKRVEKRRGQSALSLESRVEGSFASNEAPSSHYELSLPPRTIGTLTLIAFANGNVRIDKGDSWVVNLEARRAVPSHLSYVERQFTVYDEGSGKTRTKHNVPARDLLKIAQYLQTATLPPEVKTEAMAYERMNPLARQNLLHEFYNQVVRGHQGGYQRRLGRPKDKPFALLLDFYASKMEEHEATARLGKELRDAVARSYPQYKLDEGYKAVWAGIKAFAKK